MDVCQGENFSQEPKKQENKKHKKMSNWCCLDWRSCKNLEKTKETKTTKKQSTHGEGLRGSWTGDMVWFFSMGFEAFLGQDGKNLEKTN